MFEMLEYCITKWDVYQKIILCQIFFSSSDKIIARCKDREKKERARERKTSIVLVNWS